MPVPPRHDSRWQMLVEHPDAHAYHFLALKILMQRIARKPPATPAERDAAIDEVYASSSRTNGSSPPTSTPSSADPRPKDSRCPELCSRWTRPPR